MCLSQVWYQPWTHQTTTHTLTLSEPTLPLLSLHTYHQWYTVYTCRVRRYAQGSHFSQHFHNGSIFWCKLWKALQWEGQLEVTTDTRALQLQSGKKKRKNILLYEHNLAMKVFTAQHKTRVSTDKQNTMKYIKPKNKCFISRLLTSDPPWGAAQTSPGMKIWSLTSKSRSGEIIKTWASKN